MISFDSVAGCGCLLGPNEVLVADPVATVEEQSILWDWAEIQYQSGKLIGTPADPGGYSSPFHSVAGSLTQMTSKAAGRNPLREQDLIWVPDVDEEWVDPLPGEFWDIRMRVIDMLGLSTLEEDHYKGSFLSYVSPGAGVHPHRDARLSVQGKEYLILR